MESTFFKCLRDIYNFRLILAADREKHRAFLRKSCLGCFLCLVECLADIRGKSKYLAG